MTVLRNQFKIFRLIGFVLEKCCISKERFSYDEFLSLILSKTSNLKKSHVSSIEHLNHDNLNQVRKVIKTLENLNNVSI